MTSVSTRSGGAARSASSAVAPSGDRLDRVAAVAEQAGDVVPHVGVVVGEQHPAAPAAAACRPARSSAAEDESSAGPASASPAAAGSQRSASSTKARARAPLDAWRAWHRGRARPAGARSRTGRETAKSVPRPGSLSTRTGRRAASPAPGPAPARCRCPRRCGPWHLRRGGSARTVAAARAPGCRCRCRATVELGAARRAPRAVTAISPSKRELERVGEQVEDDLLPHVAVDVDRLGKRRAVDRRASGRPARQAERKLLASSAVSAARSIGS